MKDTGIVFLRRYTKEKKINMHIPNLTLIFSSMSNSVNVQDTQPQEFPGGPAIKTWALSLPWPMIGPWLGI